MTPVQKTTFLVIRHGETLWNIEERYQGHGDSPLTETGRNQARALGERMRHCPFNALICSDLGRTRETAAIIAASTGHRPAPDSRLRERNFGVLEGLTVPQIKQLHPDVLDRLDANDPEYVVPGGESHRQIYRRNVDFMEEYLSNHPGTTAALVVHGGVLDSIFRYVARLPLDQPRCFTAANTSLSVIRHGTYFDTTRWVIETWGDVGHLAGIGHSHGLG